MRLDADEEVHPDLAAEIESRLPTLGPDVAGVNLKRRHIFLGRWIRHGGRYPLVLLRIWRRGQGRVEDRWMDEHVTVSGGRTVTLEGGFADHNLHNLTFFIDKHNHYATREAIDYLKRKYRLGADQTAKLASRQAALKRLVKEQVYYRTPFWLAATGYFLYRYVCQLGFLDGRAGLIYHFLQGYWYRFLVGAKIVELEKALEGTGDTDSAKVQVLSRMTGYPVDVLL
jgi:hypothetical protein